MSEKMTNGGVNEDSSAIKKLARNSDERLEEQIASAKKELIDWFSNNVDAFNLFRTSVEEWVKDYIERRKRAYKEEEYKYKIFKFYGIETKPPENQTETSEDMVRNALPDHIVLWLSTDYDSSKAPFIRNLEDFEAKYDKHIINEALVEIALEMAKETGLIQKILYGGLT
ncbi:MAG: hypothetical protein QXR85_03460 [Candidatus Micrarchaeaceae archaeon]